MLTYEDIIKTVEAEIQMYETMRTELVGKINDAYDDDREWRSDRDIEPNNDNTDHAGIVDDYFFAKIVDAKERLAATQKRLEETQIVSTMSAGKSLLEDLVTEAMKVTVVNGEMIYGNGQKVKRVTSRKIE